jgi:hypothetical protein
MAKIEDVAARMVYSDKRTALYVAQQQYQSFRDRRQVAWDRLVELEGDRVLASGDRDRKGKGKRSASELDDDEAYDELYVEEGMELGSS